MTEFEDAKLFGGAITCVIPKGFTDASKLRQVPDNQEAFVHKENKDSIVFDICQRVEGEDIATNEDAFTFHMEDIMDGDKDIVYTPIRRISMPHIPMGNPALSCYLSNRPAKDDPNYNGILLLLLRLKDQETDIVISLNLPEMSVNEDRVEADRVNGARYRETALSLERIATTFEIKDYGLFKKS